jgi:hypothetical protein
MTSLLTLKWYQLRHPKMSPLCCQRRGFKSNRGRGVRTNPLVSAKLVALQTKQRGNITLSYLHITTLVSNGSMCLPTFQQYSGLLLTLWTKQAATFYEIQGSALTSSDMLSIILNSENKELVLPKAHAPKVKTALPSLSTYLSQ